MAHENAILLGRLFTALDQHDAEAMAACYRDDARFHDIAFDLRGRAAIRAMWRMICESDNGLRVTFDIVRADDQSGEVKLVDTYVIGPRRRPVRNVITARFRFEDGLIAEHVDDCDARAWAQMAVGGIGGWLAGRLRMLRAWKAKRLLTQFVRGHPVSARTRV
jgi:hypothetical protein